MDRRAPKSLFVVHQYEYFRRSPQPNRPNVFEFYGFTSEFTFLESSKLKVSVSAESESESAARRTAGRHFALRALTSSKSKSKFTSSGDFVLCLK